MDAEKYSANREEFLTKLQEEIETALRNAGTTPKTKMGKAIVGSMLATVFDLVVQDPAIWVAALRGDHTELTRLFKS